MYALMVGWWKDIDVWYWLNRFYLHLMGLKLYGENDYLMELEYGIMMESS